MARATGWWTLVEGWPILIPLGFLTLWTVQDAFRRTGRRTTVLHAFGVEAFYLHFLALVTLYVTAPVLMPFIGTREVVMRSPAVLSLGTMTILQLAHLVRIGGPVAVVRQMGKRPPWRRWNAWLAPGVVVGLLIAGAGIVLTTVVVLWLLWALLTARFASELVFAATLLLFILFHFVLIAVAAVGLWERQSWAPWLHLWLSLPMAILGVTFLGSVRGAPALVAGVVAAVVVLLFLWSIYTFVAGLCLCVNERQIARCARCGRVPWVRSSRCEVCDEWLLLHKDHAGAPVCLACGHEQPGTKPMCRKCRDDHWRRHRFDNAEVGGSSGPDGP